MLVLLLTAALAAPPAAPPPAALAPDLAAWATRVGVALPTADGVAVQPLPDGVAFVGRGVSLRLSDRIPGADAPAAAAVARELEPFAQAGLTASAVAPVACTVAGAPGTCQQATLSMGPGATMTVTAGGPAAGGWVAVCLDRRGAGGPPCAGILDPSADGSPGDPPAAQPGG